jgi:hypothetical protein
MPVRASGVRYVEESISSPVDRVVSLVREKGTEKFLQGRAVSQVNGELAF